MLVASLHALPAMQGGPIISCYRQGKGAAERESNFPRDSRLLSVIARVRIWDWRLRNQQSVGNQARKHGRTGPRPQVGKLAAPPLSLPTSPLRAVHGDSFLKFQKLLQQPKASPCNPSGGQILPGWRLPPWRISPAQLPFEKELGALVACPAEAHQWP